jgi:hypothetical protein
LEVEMHDTAPTGGVTSSGPLALIPSGKDVPDAGTNGAEHDRDDERRAEVEVPPAALESGDLRGRVVGDRDEQTEARAGEEAEDVRCGAIHGATLRLSHGDVDPDGEVVDRLRPALCRDSPLDLDEHLRVVLRMLRRRVS